MDYQIPIVSSHSLQCFDADCVLGCLSVSSQLILVMILFMIYK